MNKKEKKRSVGALRGYLTCKKGGAGGYKTKQIINFKTSTHTKNITDIQRGPVHFMPNDLILACIRNRTATHSSHGMKYFGVLYLKSNHSSLHTPQPKKEHQICPFLFIIFSIPNSINF
jgi:hypothetical protein